VSRGIAVQICVTPQKSRLRPEFFSCQRAFGLLSILIAVMSSSRLPRFVCQADRQMRRTDGQEIRVWAKRKIGARMESRFLNFGFLRACSDASG
jgi:hypothetical protein